MKLFTRTLLTFAIALFFATQARAQQSAPNGNTTFAADAPLEVAFCLDVSGSMIGQREAAARFILDKLHRWIARRPVRAALIAYYDGNVFSATDLGAGDVVVAEALKLARYDVEGSENVGQYIALAVQRLSWTRDANALKNTERRIVVVGNEAMRDDYAGAARRAREAGWIVDAAEGYSRPNWSVVLDSGLNQWADLARIGGGNYERFTAFAVPPRPGAPLPDQTPFDAQLRALNAQYNQTFQAYGANGLAKAQALENQEKQFDETGALFAWLVRKVNTPFPEWDFIDAWQLGTVKIDQTPDALLPLAYRGLQGEALVAELSKMLVLRRRIGGAMRALGLQRQSFLAARQTSQIDNQRYQFFQQLAAQRSQTPINPNPIVGTPSLNPGGTFNNPAPVTIPAGNGFELPLGLGALVPGNVNLGGLNVGTSFGQGPPLDLTRPADTVGAPTGRSIPILGELPDFNPRTAKPDAASKDEGPNDEFAKISNLSRWQKPVGQPSEGSEINAIEGELLLRDGEIWKARDDDFAATIRVRVSDSKSAPDFAFLLRTKADEKNDFGWRWNVKTQKWQAVTPEAIGEITETLTVDGGGFTTLRVARIANTLLMLARVDNNWKLLRRLETSPAKVPDKTAGMRQIVLQAKPSKAADKPENAELFGALEARDVALPHVDWIRFRKLQPEDLPIGTKEITDAQWLESVGKVLD